MIGKQVILTLAAAAMMAAPASAQTISVYNAAGVPTKELTRAERAIQWQATQLAAYWHTPSITFGPGGWPVYLVPQRWLKLAWGPTFPAESGVQGFHYIEENTSPYAVVGVDSGVLWWNGRTAYPNWEVTLSHEIMETLADPQLQGTEVCDPMNGAWFVYKHVALARFIK